MTNIALWDIDQQKMEYQDKLDIFLEALAYWFHYLPKIYQEKKLCELLIEIFYKTNLNNKENEKSDNISDKNEKLQRFNSFM